MSLITMLALAVDNGIDVFVTENLLEYLWLTAAKHPFNDILLVKITNFFITLSSRKNGQFVEGYYKHILELAGMNIKLLRPHLFVLWKKCGQHMSAPMNSPLR